MASNPETLPTAQVTRSPVPFAAAGGAVVQHADTAGAAAAARAKALVEAKFVMAMHKPRVLDEVRQSLLHECSRPGFANNKSTWYKKPIGDGAEGLGIRFAEAAATAMRNLDISTVTTYEDEDVEIFTVTVLDLETILEYSVSVKMEKTVERRRPGEGGEFISVRTNSQGAKTYTIRAPSEDDLLNKRNALTSKAIRTLVLRHVPVWIKDECIEKIAAVRRDKEAQDPDASRREIADAFATVNVRVAELNEFLGHDYGGCSPAELATLRGIYRAIRDGEERWPDYMEQARAERAGKAVDDLNKNAGKTPAAGSGAPPTFAQVAEQINKAKGKADVAAARTLAESVVDKAQRDDLLGMCAVRDGELQS